MKLSKWAEQEGISYTTAYRWFKAGKIKGAKQVESGTILVGSNISDAEGKLQRIIEILLEDK